MATAHLIHGYIGAGKTTLAKRLEAEHRAVRFTPDEWMARLFGEDPPAATFRERLADVLQLMEGVWLRCLSLEVDVVLDYGFWRRAERDLVRSLARERGARTVLYSVKCPEEEARSRVELRNVSDQRSLYIAPATFEGLRAGFEPLDADEERIEVTEA